MLVTAAAIGTGYLAVQLAKAFGPGRVTAVVGAEPAGAAPKADLARACGADEVFTYDEPWGAPVDLVLDAAGGPLVQRGVDALAPHGRLVAFAGGGGTVDVGTIGWSRWPARTPGRSARVSPSTRPSSAIPPRWPRTSVGSSSTTRSTAGTRPMPHNWCPSSIGLPPAPDTYQTL